MEQSNERVYLRSKRVLLVDINIFSARTILAELYVNTCKVLVASITRKHEY